MMLKPNAEVAGVGSFLKGTYDWLLWIKKNAFHINKLLNSKHLFRHPHLHLLFRRSQLRFGDISFFPEVTWANIKESHFHFLFALF